MANTNDPLGLTPADGIGGSQGAKTHEYDVNAAASIGQGGLVIRASGYAARYVQGSQSILGVAAHFVSSTGSNRTIMVYDDPDQRFIGQTSANTIQNSQTFVGQCYPVTGVALVNTTWNAAKLEILETGAGVASALNTLQCVDVSGKVGNTVNTSWTRLVVQIVKQNHVYGAITPADASG